MRNRLQRRPGPAPAAPRAEAGAYVSRSRAGRARQVVSLKARSRRLEPVLLNASQKTGSSLSLIARSVRKPVSTFRERAIATGGAPTFTMSNSLIWQACASISWPPSEPLVHSRADAPLSSLPPLCFGHSPATPRRIRPFRNPSMSIHRQIGRGTRFDEICPLKLRRRQPLRDHRACGASVTRMFVTRRVTTRAEIDSSLLMYFSRRDSIYWGADIGAETPHPSSRRKPEPRLIFTAIVRKG